MAHPLIRELRWRHVTSIEILWSNSRVLLGIFLDSAYMKLSSEPEQVRSYDDQADVASRRYLIRCRSRQRRGTDTPRRVVTGAAPVVANFFSRGLSRVPPGPLSLIRSPFQYIVDSVLPDGKDLLLVSLGSARTSRAGQSRDDAEAFGCDCQTTSGVTCTVQDGAQCDCVGSFGTSRIYSRCKCVLAYLCL